jgi:hypothetical protein
MSLTSYRAAPPRVTIDAQSKAAQITGDKVEKGVSEIRVAPDVRSETKGRRLIGLAATYSPVS